MLQNTIVESSASEIVVENLELRWLNPNRVLNMAYGVYSSEDEDQRGTIWERSGKEEAKIFETLSPATKWGQQYWNEVRPIIHTYSRCLFREKRTAMNAAQRREREYTKSTDRLDEARWLRGNVGAAKAIIRALVLFGFGFAIAQLIGGFVPVKLAEATGIWWPGFAAGAGMLVLVGIVGFIWRDFRWKHINWLRNWLEAMTDWQQLVAQERAYECAWAQLCNAYKRYTGQEYDEPPMFLGYLSSCRRQKERMVRHWQIAGMNLFHFVWMVFMRFAGRRRHAEPTLAENKDGGSSSHVGP